jgi:peptide deformylase
MKEAKMRLLQLFIPVVTLFLTEGNTMESEDTMRIFTLGDPDHCLTKETEVIADTPAGLQEAREIVRRLEETLRPRMPAAGLAAPQIGISKQAFIFSWDRSLQHLEAAINPSFQALDEEKNFGWEGCFSVPFALANVPRYQTILATYTNRDGKRVTCKLQGFAARVFQHEYDHLQGIENIQRPDAKVREFKTRDDLMTFLKEVKKGDVVNYIKPEKRENTSPS